MKEEEIREHVRNRYATAARQGASCGQSAGCCGGGLGPDSLSKRVGYSDEELRTVPEGANLGLGCGNPLALASLQEGETVLDLGSGAGFDCFLAAKQVGQTGKVIGVDMTPEMLERARGNARKGDYANVEFRLGEIENLPVADNQADIVISNCVINLSPAKERVFQEAFRALKPGGRLMVSDIVLRKDLPEQIRDSILVYTACIAGATRKEKYLDAIRAAGFQEVRVLQETVFPVEMAASDPNVMEIVKTLGSQEKIQELAGSVASVKVFARKPVLADQQAMNGWRKENTMLPKKQKQAYEDFYKSARGNDILDPKTTLLIHMASAMAFGCIPWMEHYLGVAKKEGIKEEEIGAAQSIVMAVAGGRVAAQFREVETKTKSQVMKTNTR